MRRLFQIVLLGMRVFCGPFVVNDLSQIGRDNLQKPVEKSLQGSDIVHRPDSAKNSKSLGLVVDYFLFFIGYQDGRGLPRNLEQFGQETDAGHGGQEAPNDCKMRRAHAALTHSLFRVSYDSR